MGYTFTSDISYIIQPLLNDGNYDEIKSHFDSSFETIITNNSSLTNSDISLIDDAYVFKKFLNDKNTIKTNNIMKLLATIPTDLNIKQDYQNSKDNYELKQTQNSTTIETFLEKYLYVIIQFVFFIVLFVFLYFNTNNYSLNSSNMIGKIQNKVAQTKLQTQEVINKITNTNTTI